MPSATYRSANNAVRNGNILTRKGTIKNQRSKFPYMKNLIAALKAKPVSWRRARTPRQQAEAILAENPAWWTKPPTVANAQNEHHAAATDKWVTINILIADGDILTKSGAIKTRGSTFPKMKQLLAILNAKPTSWRKGKTPRMQAYDILAENPELLKA